MFCKTCGKEINDQAVVCPYCGNQTGVVQQIPQQPIYGAPQQPNYGAPQQNTYQQPNYGAPQQNLDETNVGIVILAVLFPIVGIILGAVNMSNGKKNSGKAYLLAGIISFAVCTVIGVVVGIIAANSAYSAIAWAFR